MNNFAQREFNTIVAGACILTMNAGFINVVTLAGVFSVTVSHVTGNVSRIAISIVSGDFTTLSLVMSILFSFMFGSFISGFMVGDGKFVLGRSYGYALLLESAMLFASFLTLKGEYIVGEWCAAFACGLQNAMATSYSGLVVRTTHMTGIATDIGNILGQACRRDNHAEIWRLYVHVPILISYTVGGIIGQISYYFFREHALLIPCCATGITAITYLSLPFIQAASGAFQQKEKLAKINNKARRSTMEIRMLGDPRQVGGVILTDAQSLPGLKGATSDLEIREFFGDVNDSFEELDVENGKSKRAGGGASGKEMEVQKSNAGAFVVAGASTTVPGVFREDESTEVLISGAVGSQEELIPSNHPME
ncbi:hypothetical protein HDU98_005182 [Podochytrium sp. JEL0797]|nr:hypothetical protein HDU98_005182 [Podochytrium sp. JEL0797]